MQREHSGRMITGGQLITHLIDQLVWVGDDVALRIKQTKGNSNRLVDFGSIHMRGVNGAQDTTAAVGDDGAVRKLCDTPRASDASVSLKSYVELGVRRDGIGRLFCGTKMRRMKNGCYLERITHGCIIAKQKEDF